MQITTHGSGVKNVTDVKQDGEFIGSVQKNTDGSFLLIDRNDRSIKRIDGVRGVKRAAQRLAQIVNEQ